MKEAGALQCVDRVFPIIHTSCAALVGEPRIKSPDIRVATSPIALNTIFKLIVIRSEEAFKWQMRTISYVHNRISTNASVVFGLFSV